MYHEILLLCDKVIYANLHAEGEINDRQLSLSLIRDKTQRRNEKKILK